MSKLNTKIPPPIIALITGLIIYMLADQSGTKLDSSLRYTLSGIIAFLGLIFDVLALKHFLKAKTTINPLSPNKTQTLVTQGVYRFSRNPMYLGLLFLLSAWGVFQSTLWAIPCLMAFVVYITYFQIKPEETVLAKKFPDDFLAYKQKVNMWL